MSLACAPIHSLRRTFFAVACTLVGSLASLNSFAWDLTILHANDVHSAAAGVNDRGPVYDDTNAVGGLARVTAFVADEKAKAKDQGDEMIPSAELGGTASGGGNVCQNAPVGDFWAVDQSTAQRSW